MIFYPLKDEIDLLELLEDSNKSFYLPKIDGAAALFPVYSAFVNAVYPDTVRLYDNEAFQYNNTPDGYKLLAEKQTDISSCRKVNIICRS